MAYVEQSCVGSFVSFIADTERSPCLSMVQIDQPITKRLPVHQLSLFYFIYVYISPKYYNTYNFNHEFKKCLWDS